MTLWPQSCVLSPFILPTAPRDARSRSEHPSARDQLPPDDREGVVCSPLGGEWNDERLPFPGKGGILQLWSSAGNISMLVSVPSPPVMTRWVVAWARWRRGSAKVRRRITARVILSMSICDDYVWPGSDSKTKKDNLARLRKQISDDDHVSNEWKELSFVTNQLLSVTYKKISLIKFNYTF